MSSAAPLPGWDRALLRDLLDAMLIDRDDPMAKRTVFIMRVADVTHDRIAWVSQLRTLLPKE